MPTNQIGAGETYTTPQAWADAIDAILLAPWIGQLKNETFSGSATRLTLTGHTTTAINYIELTTASGASFQDLMAPATDRLDYNASLGAAISMTGTGSYQPVISVADQYVRINKIMIQTADPQCQDGISGSAANATFKQNIIRCSLRTNNHFGIRLNTGVATQNLVIVTSSLGSGIQTDGSATIIGNTIARDNGVAAAGNGINQDSGTSTINGNAVFKFSAALNVAGGTGNADYNATDLASFGGTGNSHTLTTQTYADQFESATSPFDFRLDSVTGDLDGAGVDDATYNAVSIYGAARTSPPAIGAADPVSSPPAFQPYPVMAKRYQALVTQ